MIFATAWVLLSGEVARAAEWDLVIRGGSIIDGTGRPRYSGSIAVQQGRIALVGKVSGTAKREINAGGRVVAPGFIDVHTHAEGILETPAADNFLRMGVTTVILGNCGASELNVAAYFQALERTNISANVATLIGHNSVRTEVMGSSPNIPTAAELSRMKSLIGQAMKDGAVGFSTGLIYTPGKFSRTAEIVELAKVAAGYGGIYTTHVRDEQEGLLNSLEEAFQVGRDAQIPVELSHLKLSGNLISPQRTESIRFLDQARQQGLADRVIRSIQNAQQSGLNISQDLYPYSAASAPVTRLLPESALEGGPETLNRRLKNASERAAVASQMKRDLLASGHTNYAHAVIVSARRFKKWQGLTILQAARERTRTDSLDAQIELILDLAAAGDVSIILYDFNEADLLPFMKLPKTMFISDSGTFQFGNETEHPRGYGSAARILAKYVREENILTLEEAIRKMTSLSASTFKLKERGEIRPGAWADLVIFDPATVQDQSNYASPHVCATGFSHVLVNGVETVTDDRHTGARAGRPLRRGE